MFAIGRCEKGQTGLGPGLETVEEPRLIAGLQGKGVCKIMASSEQGGAITEDGRLYTWGFNENNQLCHGKSTDDVYEPKLVETAPLGGLVVVDADMGGQHTCVLAREP